MTECVGILSSMTWPAAVAVVAVSAAAAAIVWTLVWGFLQ